MLVWMHPPNSLPVLDIGRTRAVENRVYVALCTRTSDEIMMLLSELNEAGKTIIMVTHENDIAAWAKRVVRMRDGHIESDTLNASRPIRPASTAIAKLGSVFA